MDIVAPVDRIPAGGETILIDDVSLINGGKGANAAVAAARLGGNVKFIGGVGNDAFGQAIRKGLEDNGIDCEHLLTSEGGSGTAIIIVDKTTSQNSIMVGPGANYRMRLPEGDDVFRWADLLMLQLETPIEINIEAARRARSAGVTVVLDPAPAQENLPEELITLTDVISPNETEMEILTGIKSDTPENAKAAAGKLFEKGAKLVVAKMGSHGAMWIEKDVAEFFPARKVKAVDTTAAGDAFTGALSLGIAEKLPRDRIMNRAMCAGALACSKFGAQPSLPTREELEAFAAATEHGEKAL
jgi:ribokinase